MMDTLTIEVEKGILGRTKDLQKHRDERERSVMSGWAMKMDHCLCLQAKSLCAVVKGGTVFCVGATGVFKQDALSLAFVLPLHGPPTCLYPHMASVPTAGVCRTFYHFHHSWSPRSARGT